MIWKHIIMHCRKAERFFKLEILGENGEVRFVQSALYEEDHHELGIITANSRSQVKQIPEHG